MDDVLHEPTTFIYCLRDPRTNAVRYVGKSTELDRRYRMHCRRVGKNPHLNRWISQLQDMGLEPALDVLEACDSSAWRARERCWELHFRAAGEPLTNIRECGTGAVPCVSTPEIRSKMSEAQKETLRNHPEDLERRRQFGQQTKAMWSDLQKRPELLEARRKAAQAVGARPEYRAKLSEVRRATWADPVYRDRMKAERRGWRYSDEARANMSEAKRRAHARQRETGQEWNWAYRTFPGFVSPEGAAVTIVGLKRFCRENNLGYTGMVRLYNGITTEYKGWTHSGKRETDG